MSVLSRLRNRLNNLENEKEEIEAKIEALKSYIRQLENQKNNFKSKIEYDLKTISTFETSYWKGNRAKTFQNRINRLYFTYEVNNYLKTAYDDPINEINNKIERLNSEISDLNSSIWYVRRQINRGE